MHGHRPLDDEMVKSARGRMDSLDPDGFKYEITAGEVVV